MIRGLVAALVLAVAGAASGSQDPVQTSGSGSVFDRPATVEQLSQTLGPLTGALRDARTLRGAFTQRKTLVELPRPLLAEGTFLFVRDRGILWRTTAPFDSELVITQDALLQRDGAGTPAFHLPGAPAARQLADIFMAVLGLDYVALERVFALYATRRNAHWVLGLRPRDTAMAGAMQQIVLEGSAQVSRVTLRDTRGDVTVITLRDTIASPEPPNADDLRWFAP